MLRARGQTMAMAMATAMGCEELCDAVTLLAAKLRDPAGWSRDCFARRR